MIRGMLNSCPFGLPITAGCKCAGGLAGGTDVAAISLMEVIDNTSDNIKEVLSENNAILSEVSNPKKCPYADKIFKNKVDCKFSERESFVSNQFPLNGSPEYPSIMVGNNSVPGFSQAPHDYSDNNNVTVYYGIVSLIN